LPIPVPGPLPAPLAINPGERQYGSREKNRISDIVEAFADDNNVMAKLEQTALATIKQFLTDFGIISGLKCNVEKSQILILGTDTVPDFVLDSGFTPVNSIKILGFNISNNFEDLVQNFPPVLDKIKTIANFWERFNLSLPGRINVAKTLMLSQISFLASIIPVPDDLIDSTQEIINKFIIGTFRFSNKMCTVPANKGGLNMINVKNFVTSLHCSWIKRACAEDIDNWRSDLNNLTGGNIINLDPVQVPAYNPILKTLSESYSRFKKIFYTTGRNFFKSGLINNDLLILNRRSKIRAGLDLFRGSAANSDEVIRKYAQLTVTDLSADGVEFITLDELIQKTNIIYTARQFNDIKTAIKDSWYLIQKNNALVEDPVSSISMRDFLFRFKKGSKNFRKILDAGAYKNTPLVRNQRVKTFFRLINLPVPAENTLEKIYADWTYTVYTVKVRDFAFKYRNNLLGLNTRVSHFNDIVQRGCTFCNLTRAGADPVPDETFDHLFYSCRHTYNVIQAFYRKFLPNWLLNDDQKVKAFIFTGISHESDTFDNFFISTIALHFNFFIWQCKLQKKIPLPENWYNEMFYTVELIRRISTKLRSDMEINLLLCRSWPEEAGRRR
jgi:hypothetical protein